MLDPRLEEQLKSGGHDSSTKQALELDNLENYLAIICGYMSPSIRLANDNDKEEILRLLVPFIPEKFSVNTMQSPPPQAPTG